jgi:hypothetical protein
MDGDISTYSRTQYATGQYDWWMIDFKIPTIILAVYVKCTNESSKSMYFEGSNDNVEWTRIDQTKFPGNAETEREYSLNVPYRYYRFINEVAYYYLQIYEVRFKY